MCIWRKKRRPAGVSLEARLFEEMLAGRDLRTAGERLTAQGEKRNDVYRARTAVQRFLRELLDETDETEESQ